MDKKYVYEFNEGDETMRELLGGKGANLAGMSKLGMPVPYGFTITTEACNQYYEDNETINDGIKAQIMEYLDLLEKKSGKKLGDEDCFSKSRDVHQVMYIFSRQNDKKLYDSLLFKDGEFDDSQLPSTIKPLLDPRLLAH